MRTETIKPAPDRRVLYPGLRNALPTEGDTVEWSVYWQRKLNDGDVVIVPPKKKPASTSARSGQE